MKVDKVFETPEGTVRFQAELTQKELDAVVTVGLNYLLQVGAIIRLGEAELEVPDINGLVN